ncbi:uncharacterized protein [Diabrotica undecimpunctata]|uniref:uncharacterized protein n=1 Tax=Diabrotica undecimpunctata TaxID=50387 RepID=UPI003B6386BB
MLPNKLLFQDMPTARTHQRQTLEGEPVELFYGRLPYIRGLFPQITNLFRQFNIVIANSVYKTLGTYFTHLTERVKKLDNFNVVYSIPCGSCSEVYVGQSSQKLSKRIALHKSDVVRKPTSTAFSQHIKNTGHTTNYENVEVLKSVDKQFKRNFIEMCYIHNCSSSMNCKKDVENLSCIYSFLLKQDLTRCNRLKNEGGLP